MTFLNYDGTVTLDKQSCASGGSVVYGGEIPEKPKTIPYSYTFADAWLTAKDGSTIDDLANVTSNRSVYPKFGMVANKECEFGTYPQSKVSDIGLISTLASPSCHQDLSIVVGHIWLGVIRETGDCPRRRTSGSGAEFNEYTITHWDCIRVLVVRRLLKSDTLPQLTGCIRGLTSRRESLNHLLPSPHCSHFQSLSALVFETA